MNCKPGDLAVIVKGRTANIGRLVRVIAAYGDVDYSEMGYGLLPCWTVESMGSMLDRVGGPAMTGFIPDLALRPMTGAPLGAHLTERIAPGTDQTDQVEKTRRSLALERPGG